MFISARYKDQKMCNKAADISILMHYDMSPTAIRTKKYMIKLSVRTLLQYKLLMINLRPKKCVIKPNIIVNLCVDSVPI